MKKPPGTGPGVCLGAANRGEGLHHPLALRLLARELALHAGSASAFWRAFFSDGFSKCCLSFISRNTPFALELLLQGPEGLIDIVVANADLHVVFTTFLS